MSTVRRCSALLALVLSASCGERTESEPAADAAVPTDTAPAVVPAQYRSSFAFVGAVPAADRFVLELANEVRAGDLERRYDAWLADGEHWRPVLRLRDALPVPRAAWRILPGRGLRVRVAEGGEALEIAVRDTTGWLRLLRGPGLSEWTGATGQREALALATLARDSVAQPGLLLVRRSALREPWPEGPSEHLLFLLADSRGNGLFVASGGEGDPTVAWAWWHGVSRSWSDASVGIAPAVPDTGRVGAAPAASFGTAAGWVVDVSAASLHIEVARTGGDADRILVEGELREEKEIRAVRGLVLRSIP